MDLIQAVLLRFGRRARRANPSQTEAIDHLATSDLLALARRWPRRSSHSRERNRQAEQEIRAQRATAGAACRVLAARGLQEMERNGADLQVCQVCTRFHHLSIEDVGGCPHAGQATCLGRRRTAPSSPASCESETRSGGSSKSSQSPSSPSGCPEGSKATEPPEGGTTNL